MLDRAAVLMAIADGPPIEYRTSAATAGDATVIVKPTGVEVDDLVFVFAGAVDTNATLSTASGSTWGKISAAIVVPGWDEELIAVFWKVMAATDVANAWNLSSAVSRGAVALRYAAHGANTVTLKSIDNNNGAGIATVDLAGYSKAAGHYGSVTFVASTSATGYTQPAGFDMRHNASTSGAGGSARLAVADRMYGYVDGTALVWSLSGDQGIGLLVEVAGP